MNASVLRKLCRNQYARAGFLAAWLAGQARSLAGVGQAAKKPENFLLDQSRTSRRRARRGRVRGFRFAECGRALAISGRTGAEQASEDGVNVAGGVEVSGFAELVGVAGIVALDRM